MEQGAPMLHFRHHLQRTRQLVWLTLFVWCFALGLGVVNACVLGLPGTGLPGAAQAGGRHANQHGRTAHPTHSESADNHGQDSGKDTCLKFCDDGTGAVVKATTSGTDVLVGLVERVGLRAAVASVERVADGAERQRPRSQGPPLVIRFLRLTL